jgi:hypothetical protein
MFTMQSRQEWLPLNLSIAKIANIVVTVAFTKLMNAAKETIHHAIAKSK